MARLKLMSEPSTPDGATPQTEVEARVQDLLWELRTVIDAIEDPDERLAVLNTVIDGKDARWAQGERQKLDPWGRWMHSTYLDASQGHPEWRESSETRKIIDDWRGGRSVDGSDLMLDANLLVSDTGIDNKKGERLHVPMFDIDLPMRVVPSTNPGKGHLYINKPMPWADIITLLDALVAVGIVHRNYRAHSVERGSTTLRPAFVDKPKGGWDSELARVEPDWANDPMVPRYVVFPDAVPKATFEFKMDKANCEQCKQGIGSTSPGPGHDASPYCRSGKRPHCSCDTCY